MLNIFYSAIFCSFFVGVLLIKFQHIHERYSSDHDLLGVQKFHLTPVPRVGGIAILFGFSTGIGFLYVKYHQSLPVYLIAACTPVFLAGILEDITKKVGAWYRLMASLVAALIGSLTISATINRVDITFIDYFIKISPIIPLLFTAFAVGGVAHAVNIIDGYNGLSSMVALLITTSLAYVCFKVNDSLLIGCCFALMGSLLGFFVLNFPRGHIFAGDGGAYLIGFLIAEIAVLLVARHSEVSAWYPLLAIGYPVVETLFSIYRKKLIRGVSPGVPDGLHLHMLVYKRLVRWMTENECRSKIKQNSMTSPYLWALAALSIAPATYFWNNTQALMLCALVFCMIYIGVYRMIVQFKSPSWLRLHHRRLTRSRSTTSNMKSK